MPSFRGAPLLVGDTAEVVSPSASQVQRLMPHNYILSCTVYAVVQQSILVDYCCFHLTSGASTRNRRPLLSTLREEFVGKKYQVFDIIGPLLILSQVKTSHPRWIEFKSRGILAANHNNIGAASLCSSVRDVQKLLKDVAHSCRAALVFIYRR